MNKVQEIVHDLKIIEVLDKIHKHHFPTESINRRRNFEEGISVPLYDTPEHGVELVIDDCVSVIYTASMTFTNLYKIDHHMHAKHMNLKSSVGTFSFVFYNAHKNPVLQATGFKLVQGVDQIIDGVEYNINDIDSIESTFFTQCLLHKETIAHANMLFCALKDSFEIGNFIRISDLPGGLKQDIILTKLLEYYEKL